MDIYSKYEKLSKDYEQISMLNLKYRNRILDLNNQIDSLTKNLKESKTESNKSIIDYIGDGIQKSRRIIN